MLYTGTTATFHRSPFHHITTLRSHIHARVGHNRNTASLTVEAISHAAAGGGGEAAASAKAAQAQGGAGAEAEAAAAAASAGRDARRRSLPAAPFRLRQ